jgi:hypothetical protein
VHHLGDLRTAGGERAGRDHGGRAGLERDRGRTRATGAGRDLGDARDGRVAGVRDDRVQERGRRDRGRRHAQRRAGAVDELADRAVGEPELLGDLGMRAAVDRDGEQGGPLARGQRGDARERVEHLVPALELGGRLGGEAAGGLRDLLHRLADLLERVDRRVVGDAVQPRAQLAHLGARAQRRPRADERRLHHVLGERVRQEAPQIAQQRAPVALDDRLERAVVTGGGKLGEPLVGLRAQQG